MSRSLRRPLLLLAAAGGLLTCGEGPSGATRRVTAVLISRDSVYLEVGDSVVVRAEARDVNGDPMPEAPITWESLDGAVVGVVTSGATGRIFAVAHGVAGVVASSEGHADTTAVSVRPPIIATILASHTDTVRALGDTLAIAVSSQSASGPRFGQYDAVSRSTAIVLRFDANAHVLHVTTQVPSDAYVVVRERGGTQDSALIVVRQHPAR